MKEPRQVSPVSCSLRSDVFCLCWVTWDPTCFREIGSVSEYPQRTPKALLTSPTPPLQRRKTRKVRYPEGRPRLKGH